MFYIYLHLVLCDMVEQAVLVVAAVQQEVAANLPLIHVLIPTQNMYRCEIWQCGGAGGGGGGADKMRSHIFPC